MIDENRKEIFNVEIIKSISKEIIRQHTVSGVDQLSYNAFKAIEENEIDYIIQKVNKGNYKFSKYKEKLIIKNRKSKPRCISIPTHRDKICLKGLDKVLKLYYMNIRQPLVHSVISELMRKISSEEYTHFIKLDLTSFYDNINHKILLDRLDSDIEDKIIVDLVDKAIKNPVYPETENNKIGVHQGLSVSNFLAEIYMNNLDLKYESNKDLFYIRYIDDIVILCKRGKITKLKKEFEKDVKILKLNISKHKSLTGILKHDDFLFLGYKISFKNERLLVSPNPSKIIKFESRLIQLIKRYQITLKEEPNKFNQFVFEFNLLISGSISKKVSSELLSEKRYGWLFFYSQMNDLTVLYHIDKLVENMLSFVEPDLKKRFKKITKAYYEQKYNLKESDYFFRPDNLSIAEKKMFLRNTYLIKSKKLQNNKSIEYLFQKIVYKQIKQQELDLLSGNS